MMEHLTAEQRSALALLMSAGRDGLTQEQLNALGFEPRSLCWWQADRGRQGADQGRRAADVPKADRQRVRDAFSRGGR